MLLKVYSGELFLTGYAVAGVHSGELFIIGYAVEGVQWRAVSNWLCCCRCTVESCL